MSAPVKPWVRQRLQSRYSGRMYQVKKVEGDMLRLVSTDGQRVTVAASDVAGSYLVIG